MRSMKHMNPGFSQYYAEFHVIAGDLVLNSSAVWNASQMGIPEDRKNFFTYGYMPEKVPAFVTVCQEGDDQIQQ